MKIQPTPFSKHISVFAASLLVFITQEPVFFLHMKDRLWDKGDAILNMWILEWDTHAFTTPGAAIWNAPIFYPVQNALTFSETLLGNLWIFFPIRILFGNPILADNIVLLLSYLLSAYAVFLLVHDLTHRYWPALLAGILFSFNPHIWAHNAHLQLLPFYWAPLALFCFNRYTVEQRARYLTGMTISMVCLYYCSIYLGTMLLTLILVLFIIHFILECSNTERRMYVTRKNILLPLAGNIVAAAVLLLPLGYHYLQTTIQWDIARTLHECMVFSARPVGFLYPVGFNNYGWLGNLLQFSNQQWEGRVFLGMIPLLFSALALILQFRSVSFISPYQHRVLRRYALAALVMALLMLGPYLVLAGKPTEIPLPFQIVHYCIPGGKAIRVPARFVRPLLLCMAVLCGFSFAWLFDVLRRRVNKFVRISTLMAIGIFWLFDYAVLPGNGYSMDPPEKFPPVYRYLSEAGPDRPYLEYPLAGIPWETFKYMYYQTLSWRPILGGTSGWLPPPMYELIQNLSRPSAQSFAFLRATPAMTFIVHLELLSEGERNAWLRADLSPYGFHFVNRMGDALVWERTGGLDPYSPTLTITRAYCNQDPDNFTIAFLATPTASRKAWTFFEKKYGDVTARIVTETGRTLLLHPQVPMPSYILPDDKRSLSVALPFDPMQEKIKTLEINGPLFENFHSDNISVFNEARSSLNKRSGLQATLVNGLSISENRVKTGGNIVFNALVRNSGASTWLNDRGKGKVSLGVLWFHADDLPACKRPRTPAVLGERIPIPAIVAPGEEVHLTGSLPVPSAPGRYRVLCDMVSEEVVWFSDIGNSFLECHDVIVDQ